MKVGTVLAAAAVALGVISTLAVLTPDNSAQEEIQSIKCSLEVYEGKKMYAEAVGEYQKLLRLEQFANDAGWWEKYRQCCSDNGFGEEMISASRKLLELAPENTQPAHDVLEWYKNNNPDEVYAWLNYLKDALSEENYREFGEYYDSVKGEYFILKTGYASLGEWSAAEFGENRAGAYLTGTDKDGRVCVIGADGRELVKSSFEKIYSYSYTENLIAADDDGQPVYVNVSSSRKRVPYNYSDGTLVKHSYLGPYCGGLANFQGADGKWGYLNQNADVVYGDFAETLPGVSGIFAVKNGSGKWSILRQNASGNLERVTDTDYDDIRRDEYGYAFKNGIFFGSVGGSWYMNRIVADEDGNYSVVKYDTPYEDAKVFGELGAVKTGGKWGFADENGDMKIEPQFEDARSFSCGFAAVKTNGDWGYIDKSGKTVISPTFKEAGSFSRYGIAAVRLTDDWELIRLKEYKISGGVYK